MCFQRDSGIGAQLSERASIKSNNANNMPIQCENMSTKLVVVKCSKCRRIEVNDSWMPEPRFLARDASYTHTYCPECLAEEIAKLKEYAPSK